MRRTALLFISIFLLSAIHGQTRVIRGQLTAFNRFPVANVEVTAKKAKSSISTDKEGRFELVCYEKDVIQIKAKVFQAASKKLGNEDEFMKINLIFKDSPKNRKIATGLGYISEESLAFALANLQDENNDFCTYTDVYSLIRGKLAGVEVKSKPSGVDGVFIRGSTSIMGSNEALYVVDGTMVTDISFLIPCEIRSINVLKGAAAGIYGSRAATGVVVIETKSTH